MNTIGFSESMLRRMMMLGLIASLTACAANDADEASAPEPSSTGGPSADTGSDDGAPGSTSTASEETGVASTGGGDSGGSSSGSTDGGSESSGGGPPAVPWADCDAELMCGGDDQCVINPLPGEGPGLQWCGAPCDPDGAGDECPDPPLNSETSKTCFDLHDGTGACALDCSGGFACPTGMSCFNGNLCLYGET